MSYVKSLFYYKKSLSSLLPNKLGYRKKRIVMFLSFLVIITKEVLTIKASQWLLVDISYELFTSSKDMSAQHHIAPALEQNQC